jgi:hypothetical protein
LSQGDMHALCVARLRRKGHHGGWGTLLGLVRVQSLSVITNMQNTKCLCAVHADGTRSAGGKKDSWLIDYEATKNCLDVGREAGASHFVLLSAICVQASGLWVHQLGHLQEVGSRMAGRRANAGAGRNPLAAYDNTDPQATACGFKTARHAFPTRRDCL